MASRDYWLTFGIGASGYLTYSGLAPTFVTFITPTGANATPPSISEPGSKGLYKFSYDAGTTAISFVVDGATTSLSTSQRYIAGLLEANDQVASLIGNTSSSYGSASVDPTTVFGFLKRAQEVQEGNSTYTKSSGALTIYSRGSTTLLRTKSISDSTTSTTKT